MSILERINKMPVILRCLAVPGSILGPLAIIVSVLPASLLTDKNGITLSSFERIHILFAGLSLSAIALGIFKQSNWVRFATPFLLLINGIITYKLEEESIYLWMTAAWVIISIFELWLNPKGKSYFAASTHTQT